MRGANVQTGRETDRHLDSELGAQEVMVDAEDGA